MNNKIYIAGRITGDPGYKAKFKATEAMLSQARRFCKERAQRNEHQHCSGCPFYDRDYITMCRISDIFPRQIEVVNPVDFGLDGKPYWPAIIYCLWQLSQCRYVYFIRDWKQSRGAQIEHRWARWLKKQIIYQK
jgi:hypothetical protein